MLHRMFQQSSSKGKHATTSCNMRPVVHYSMEDVGQPKATTAAKRVMERVQGCEVTAHVGRIEEKPDGFYEQFPVIILGLDSLEARRYMNQVACSFLGTQPLCESLSMKASNMPGALRLLYLSSTRACSRLSECYPCSRLLSSCCSTTPAMSHACATSRASIVLTTSHNARRAEFAPDGTVKQETMKPLIDGGTEGFKGHARVILPGQSPCFDCTLWLFPPQVTFPLCTLAETPRSPAHCIEYAHLLLWGKHWGNTAFDSDNEEDMKWVRAQSQRY
jgi:molybdopterin/thiamine biosynthesis adenylyltransferase